MHLRRQEKIKFHNWDYMDKLIFVHLLFFLNLFYFIYKFKKNDSIILYIKLSNLKRIFLIIMAKQAGIDAYWKFYRELDNFFKENIIVFPEPFAKRKYINARWKAAKEELIKAEEF